MFSCWVNTSGTAWDSVGQRGAAWDSVGQRGTARGSVGQRGAAWRSVEQREHLEGRGPLLSLLALFDKLNFAVNLPTNFPSFYRQTQFCRHFTDKLNFAVILPTSHAFPKIFVLPTSLWGVSPSPHAPLPTRPPSTHAPSPHALSSLPHSTPLVNTNIISRSFSSKFAPVFNVRQRC